jgi:hypothetical protein
VGKRRKETNNNRKWKIVVIITIFLFSIFSLQFSFVNVRGQNIQGVNNDTIMTSSTNYVSAFRPGDLTITEHKITAAEVGKLKSQQGVYQAGVSYNQLINDHGTGLRPPTADEWTAISQNSYFIDSVGYADTPASIDNSNSSYFPPIGNQGSQNSCVAWSVAYYIATFNEAKANEWNLTGALWSGGQPTTSYQNRIISPAFLNNLINNGQNQGTDFSDAINLVCSIGVSSWMNMPYIQSDYTSWPSQAAWTEASLYRGNSSGYQYLPVTDTNGINNLKNLLASGNLVSISVDANKFSSLSTNDVWSLDNYNSPQPDHAGTIVGYDDNFSYVESGHVTYGAFKVANSWGISSWEPIQTGFYWISYAAMQQRIYGCYYYFPRTSYQPNLLAIFKINDNSRGNCIITVGLGTPNNPIKTKSFTQYISGGNQPFCSNNIVMDISEFTPYMPGLYNQPFYLQVFDTGSYSTNGTIMYFDVGNCSALDTPCPTVKNQNVFLNLIYNPRTIITLLPAGLSTPVSGANYFTVLYTMNGQRQVASAQNGTLILNADAGTSVDIAGISSNSNATEQWTLDSLGPLGYLDAIIPSGSTATLYYYNTLSQQVAYNISGSGNPAPPLLFYNTAPSTPSSELNTANNATLLSGNSQPIMVLRGTTASITNNILGTSQDQWVTPISSWNISQVNQIPNLLIYYHQYQFTTSYATPDNSTPSSPPLLSGIQFSAPYQIPLADTFQTTWLDENTQWSISTVVTTPSGTEQWIQIADPSNSGTITQSVITPILLYSHQFYLAVASAQSNVATSGSGWYNVGSTAYAGLNSGTESGGTGTQYIFASWSTGGTNYQKSNPIIINGTFTAAANWNTQYYLTVNSPHGLSTGSGWYNSGSDAQATLLSNTVSGNSGTQYAFSGWTGDASGSGLSTNIIAMNAPKIATATWTTQYQLTLAVTPPGCGLSTPTGNNLWVTAGPVSISTSPNSGFTFSRWTASNGLITFASANSNTTTANVNGPGIITATLALKSTPTPSPILTPDQHSSSISTSSPTTSANDSPSPTPTATVSEFPLTLVITIMLMAVAALLSYEIKHYGKINR